MSLPVIVSVNVYIIVTSFGLICLHAQAQMFFSLRLLYLMVRNVFIASLKIVVVVVRITGLKSYPPGVEGVPLHSLTLLANGGWGKCRLKYDDTLSKYEINAALDPNSKFILTRFSSCRRWRASQSSILRKKKYLLEFLLILIWST